MSELLTLVAGCVSSRGVSGKEVKALPGPRQVDLVAIWRARPAKPALARRIGPTNQSRSAYRPTMFKTSSLGLG